MTPKEKAIDLVKRFSKDFIIMCKSNDRRLYTNEAIQCALIAVDEILLDKKVGYSKDIIEEKQYWKEVKQELQNFCI